MGTGKTEIYCKGTRKTPEVVIEDGRFRIEGRSIPENPGIFYKPLYDWIIERFSETEGKPVIEFAFDYLNTASAKWVFLILRDIANTGREFKLVWYYEKGDEDMCELGMMYKSLLGCQFAAVEVDEIQGYMKDFFE